MVSIEILYKHFPNPADFEVRCAGHPELEDVAGYLRADGFSSVCAFETKADLMGQIAVSFNSVKSGEVPLIYICSETLFAANRRPASVLMIEMGSVLSQLPIESAEIVVQTGQGCANLMAVIEDFQRRVDCDVAHVILAEHFSEADRLDKPGHDGHGRYVFSDGLVHLRLSKRCSPGISVGKVVRVDSSALLAQSSNPIKFRKIYEAHAARFRAAVSSHYPELKDEDWCLAYPNYGDRKVSLLSNTFQIPLKHFMRPTLPELAHFVGWDVFENALQCLDNGSSDGVFAMSSSNNAWYMIKLGVPLNNVWAR